MATNYTMKVNGSLVNVEQGTLDVINQIGQRSTGTVTVWSALGVTWQYGTSVQVYDTNSNLVYSGYISKDKMLKVSRQGHGYLEHQLTLMDNCYRADKRLIFANFLNVSAGTIVQSMLDTVLASEGVTATASSIAAGATLAEVVWIGKQCSAALTWLANTSGYWWNIDTAGVLWFQPYTGLPAPIVLDGTQVSVDSNLSVTTGNDQYVNRQFVKGAFAELGQRTETFHGNSLNQAFTLSYEVSTLVSITLDGITQSVGTKGTAGSEWYYATGDAVIAQDVGGTPIASGDTLAVTYKGRYPILALSQNNALITAQKAREGSGTGYVESEFNNAKLTTLAAANQAASSLLAYYGANMTQLEFDTLTSGLQPGQMLTVNLSDFNLSSAQMLITMVEITDTINENFNIWFHVQAVGSPIGVAQWQTYWQNLMNQSADATDLSSIDDAAGLAFLFTSFITLAATVVVHPTVTMCPICNTSTLCGSGSPVIC